MTSVELRRVSKVYAGTTPGCSVPGCWVFEQIDLHVADGELLVLLGPNGSGKTTLLRLIAGLEPVTSGQIVLGGRVVNDWPPRRRNVAMMFQSGVLYPHLTVEQNLKFGWKPQDKGGAESRIGSRLSNRAGAASVGDRSDDQERRILQDRVRETAQLLGIESMLNRLPRQLSGGERQRVALGRVLVRQPAVFLLDEPLANADARLREELRVAFQRARLRFPGTMILVSHDQAEALALGQRIAVLGEGKIQQLGLAADVYANPRNRFVAEFLGRTSTSFVDGAWRREADETVFLSQFGRVILPPAAVGRLAGHLGPVSLGLRTEAVSVRAGLPGEADWSGVVRWLEWREEGSVAYVALRPAGIFPSAGGEVDASEQTVVARVLPPEGLRPGDPVRLEVDWSRTLWFDPSTGTNLAR
jgi:multiple sugar transport system ATP-binding protein